MHSEKVTFTNDAGVELAAKLEQPIGKPRAYAIFAHCFTCSKDIAAATRISRALAAAGIGVLRFDFTGLGGSGGDFANTNFSSNIQDLVAAAGHLEQHYSAPQLMIGHSLGGTATLFAAGQIASIRAVATIGSPFEPDHVIENFRANVADIESSGKAEVQLAGRKFTIEKQFLDDLRAQDPVKTIGSLRKALLILHSPIDELVDVDNARRLYEAARHPKSFVSLDQADHLLTKARDSQYVASLLAAWAQRYLDPMTADVTTVSGGHVVVSDQFQSFTQHVQAERHELVADEPKSVGGKDLGPNPYELLLSSLGACTSMTIRMYAQRKGWQVDQISVDLAHHRAHGQDCVDCESPKKVMIDVIDRTITIAGDLDVEQHARLMEIADRCPVHRTLTGTINIRTQAQSDYTPSS